MAKVKNLKPVVNMGSGVYFKRAVKKYGRDVFERTILEYCDTPNELEIAETKWIEHYDAANNPIFYNISPNSGGGHHGRDQSGENNPMWGKKHPNHVPHYGEDNGMYGVRRYGSDNPNSKILTMVSPSNETYTGCIKEICILAFGDDSQYAKFRHFVKQLTLGKNSKRNPYYGWTIQEQT